MSSEMSEKEKDYTLQARIIYYSKCIHRRLQLIIVGGSGSSVQTTTQYHRPPRVLPHVRHFLYYVLIRGQ